jgi:hypothetical protein
METATVTKNLSITLTEEQGQALAICLHLLNVGTFSVQGQALESATRAKALLVQVVQSIEAALKSAEPAKPAE